MVVFVNEGPAFIQHRAEITALDSLQDLAERTKSRNLQLLNCCFTELRKTFILFFGPINRKCNTVENFDTEGLLEKTAKMPLVSK